MEGGRITGLYNKSNIKSSYGTGYVPLLLQPNLGSNDNTGVHYGDGFKKQGDKKELEIIGEKLKNLKKNTI